MPNGRATPLKPLKWYQKLATGKARLEFGAFLLEGNRAIQQVISAHPETIIEIISVEEPPRDYYSYPVRLVTESQLRSISSVKTPQGIIAVVRLPPDTYSSHLPEHPGDKILLLEDIQDPGNTGTLIRTAAAFDFSGVILTDKCADPFSPKCVQSTAGAALSVWLRRTNRYLGLIEALQAKGYTLAATDLNGSEDARILQQGDRLLLALGNEASGLTQQLLNMAEYRLKIPTVRERAESLNVAACGAIFMYLSSTREPS